MTNENPLQAGSLFIGLVLSLSLLLLQIQTDKPPSPKSADVPDSQFSAYRAEAILRHLLAENRPHPVGTPENRLVKARIIEKLKSYGLQTVVQKTIGCSTRYPGCAWVENVLARIPGRESGSAVLLMAHYDSVPMAPGAGDDGAGVAALLETARTVAAEAPYRNPIMFVFTDAEEMGLLGAEAFFKEHPWAKEAGVALNIEGSGSEGASLLLRTGTNNNWVVDAYRQSVSYRSAVSLSNEIFKRMPNDTDFSVVQRANLPGIDFAFAGERNHYHTPLDTLDNLNLATLQHHGENVLPLTRQLANMNLADQEGGDSVYVALFSKLWLSWPERYSIVLALLSLAPIALAAINLVRAGETTVMQMSIGFSISVLVLLAVIGVDYAGFKAIEWSKGTMVSWPAHLWPLRLCVAAATLTGGLVAILTVGRFVNFWSLLLGGWILWALASLAAAWFAPSASNFLLIPTLASALVILAATTLLMGRQLCRELTVCLGLLIVTPFTLGVFLPLEQSQGYRLILATFIPLGLYMVTLAPLLLTQGTSRHHKALLGGSMALFAIGFFFSVSLPLYSVNRPQHLNIMHIQDRDSGTAHWLLDSPDPLPPRIQELGPFVKPVQPVTPWSRTNHGLVATADVTEAPAPLLHLLSTSTNGGVRELKLKFQSRRGANYAMILIDKGANLQSLTIEGRAQSTRLTQRSVQDYYVIRASGVPEEGFELQLGIGNPERIPCYVIDWTTELPAAASELLDARSPLATPVHQGDQALIFMRTSI
jgi:hypothetical protein|tara:strand:- start:9324 stop:11615 length:2292 start_codon:yes stop_codon:yes gene_type:complete